MIERVIYRTVVGSQAYGLATDGSDTDVRGIYLPSASEHWALKAPPEQFTVGSDDESYWEVGKLIRLALKCNPSVLEVLWTQTYEASATGQMIRDMRDAFLGKELLYEAYTGYAFSQLSNALKLVQQGREPKWKHVMHMLRLLYCCNVALRENRIPVFIEDVALREYLHEVRRGERDFEEVREHALKMEAQNSIARERSTLPEQPDREKADLLLIYLRKMAYHAEEHVTLNKGVYLA